MSETDHKEKKYMVAILSSALYYLFLANGLCDQRCMILFLNMMSDSAGMELGKEHIEQAAKITFLNVVLLSLLCTVIDGIRRKYMVNRPVRTL